ncbi:hypothetical protein BZG36_04781 [Bifiguratus adelaidae]|uniref:C2H2-type domain-containing protein n=1 Tax=Bifiguratus adelaidae TaxID=1938954 RepID=A0A261XWD4_9FUNG|nr:hypothetical protein BZG36_04781 [Bifiguratus adelaidae]
MAVLTSTTTLPRNKPRRLSGTKRKGRSVSHLVSPLTPPSNFDHFPDAGKSSEEDAVIDVSRLGEDDMHHETSLQVQENAHSSDSGETFLAKRGCAANGRSDSPSFSLPMSPPTSSRSESSTAEDGEDEDLEISIDDEEDDHPAMKRRRTEYARAQDTDSPLSPVSPLLQPSAEVAEKHDSPPADTMYRRPSSPLEALMLALESPSVQPLDRVEVPSASAPSENAKQNGSSKRTYACRFSGCDRFFMQLAHLRIHERCHTGLRPYACEYPGCDRAFTQLGNLKTHERKHTGERPYACTFPGCDKTFTQHGNLKTHERIHRDVKPFQCPAEGCGKGFTQLGNLKTHISKLHPELAVDSKPRSNSSAGRGKKRSTTRRASASAVEYKAGQPEILPVRRFSLHHPYVGYARPDASSESEQDDEGTGFWSYARPSWTTTGDDGAVNKIRRLLSASAPVTSFAADVCVLNHTSHVRGSGSRNLDHEAEEGSKSDVSSVRGSALPPKATHRDVVHLTKQEDDDVSFEIDIVD